MLYPKKDLERKIGFDKIRLMLKENCISILGQDFVNHISFLGDYEQINQLTQQTLEFSQILKETENFPQQNYIDIRTHLRKTLLEGNFLSEEEFFDLKLVLQTIYSCIRFFKSHQESCPELYSLTQTFLFEKNVIDKIDLVINERGKVRDNASFELRSIREKMLANQNYLRKRLEQILKQARKHGYTKEDNDLTIRSERLVIPVTAEHKRKIKGFVHDESATGQTVFLEPAEVIDLNNEIKELKYKEKREIIRILTHLTDQVRPEVYNLQAAIRFLGEVDFIQSKAKLALYLEATKPKFSKQTLLNWKEAQHALLKIKLAEEGKSIVPLDIKLSFDDRVLLISGPNAGGKSIALKTVGLLQYMFQCGLLIPIHESSEIGLFQDIFIDIGDEQSLENDLSTYSSHLTNMTYFLNFSTKKTLFLIDEFGTGTEPAMGAAIAESILEKLHESRAFGVITTHYSNLKYYAENTEGLVNGAMRFDNQKLEPLYELEIGKPGSSFAFEIAHKIGLPRQVIENAKSKVGDKQFSMETILRELEVEKEVFETKNKHIKQKEEVLEEITQEYKKLKVYLEAEKKRILNQAKSEAKSIIDASNQKIEQTIKEIKESQAEKETTKAKRKDLESFKTEELVLEEVAENEAQAIEEVKTKKKPKKAEEKEEIKVLQGEIKVGDSVRIKGQEAIGEVLTLKGKDAEISMGLLKSTIRLNRLEKVNRNPNKNNNKSINSSKGIDFTEKMKSFSPSLDLRGKRGEEAILILNDFLDDAILLAQKQLTILHGKGNGILRSLVREQLRKYKEVKRVSDEHADRGGAGVTLVSLEV